MFIAIVSVCRIFIWYTFVDFRYKCWYICCCIYGYEYYRKSHEKYFFYFSNLKIEQYSNQFVMLSYTIFHTINAVVFNHHNRKNGSEPVEKRTGTNWTRTKKMRYFTNTKFRSCRVDLKIINFSKINLILVVYGV